MQKVDGGCEVEETLDPKDWAQLRSLGLPVEYRSFPTLERQWRNQLDAGLTWALRSTASG